MLAAHHQAGSGSQAHQRACGHSFVKSRWYPAEKCGVAIDGNGNLVSDGATTYTWDARDRLLSTTGSPAYGYDPSNLRVSMGGQKVLLDGIEEVREYGATDLRYDHDSSRIDGLLAQKSSSGKGYFITDALGSVYGLVDSTGAVVSKYSYDVYGARTPASEAMATSWGFAGRRHDSATEMYYRVRHLDGNTGAFLSADPFGMVDGPNRYVFVRAQPARHLDPLGLATSLQVWTEPINNRFHLDQGPKMGFFVPLALKILKLVSPGEYPRHTYFELSCNGPDCDDDFPDGIKVPFHLRVELTGPLVNNRGHLSMTNFYLDSNSLGWIEKREWVASNWGRLINLGMDGPCGLAKCITKTAKAFGSAVPDYNPLGPNSNTFAADIARTCGVYIFFNDDTEVGWDYSWGGR